LRDTYNSWGTSTHLPFLALDYSSANYFPMELVSCFQELFQQPAMHPRRSTYNDSQTHIFVLTTAHCRLFIPSTVIQSDRVTLRLTVCQSVRLGVQPTLGLTTRCYFPLEVWCLKFSVLSLFGRPLWREVRSVICQSKSVVVCQVETHIYIFCVIHISDMYIQCIKSFFQSRLGTADYAPLFTSSSRYHGSSDTWTVVHMTAAKFKSLIFSVSGFALSNIENIFIIMTLDDVCLLPACFCYVIVNVRNLESHMQISDWRAPQEFANCAENLILKALQLQ
jgi:hypothetical protein